MIKSYLKGDKFIYKIGYSDDENIQIRLASYFYMNPGCEIIGTREGDEMLESLFHRYLYFLGYQFQIDGKLSEWFRGEKRVLDLFYIPQETLEQKVWENRDKMFDFRKLSRKGNYELEKSLLVYLFTKNRDSFLSQTILSKLDQRLHKLLINCGEIELSELEISDNNHKELVENLASDFLENFFYSTGIFHEKMKIYCEFMDQHQEYNSELQDIIYSKIKDGRFRLYYNHFGTNRCKALEYRELNLYNKMFDVSKEHDIKDFLHKSFHIGKRYSLKKIKLILLNLYQKLGVTKNPKATDLRNYFIIKRVRVQNPETKKLDEGYLIQDYK